ncbi:3-oxoacyl-ACP reductase [Pseudoroseomonas rhizosphaerae]|uniref:3-oxoacyl-ACP reductase n=1 Tax=Teichococcus rhizosphaerae TaxID=1335062 RepID=A0A2C7ADG2_9PROT|nr:SDR family NAD(P)-dependent oxidoreductase [Pseudoroseomonas rhizosphaerae]PHK96470.1 3-oxoacyl-ACP reductase [Pseudoroseomonas rhizosphaerae]
MLRLDGKVAFVTGAGSAGPGWGNGKATAVLMARQGAWVFALDNRAEAAEETVAIIRAEGGEAMAHVADVTAAAQVAEAVAACVSAYGGIDILVNNVGGSFPGGAESLSEEDWERQIDFNLRSAFLCCKHAMPHLRARGRGAIVNLSSIAALRMSADRPHIAYSASKYGILALTKSVAMEQARQGVRCNTVVPGLMHTPLVEHRLVRQLGANDAEQLIARRNAQVPMGRMGDAWDIAHAVLFLASDEAKHITGTEIVVDGGISAAMP